jgi:hypothetical protein
MRSNEQPTFEVVRHSVRRFLHSQSTGCSFAAEAIKNRDSVHYAMLDGEPADDTADLLSSAFDAAISKRELIIVVFPGLRSQRAVGALVDVLVRNARWHVDRGQVPSEPAFVVDKVYWTNIAGERVSILGLAPMLSMPATRRAAFVCFVAWPGSRSNPHRTGQFPAIGIGDMPLRDGLSELSKDRYTAMVQETKAKVAGLNGARVPSDVTFVYEASAVGFDR